MSAIYDNWERLVAAALKKQQLWELFHDHSRSPSILSEASDFSSSFNLSCENSSKSREAVPNLVLISDFSPACNAKDVLYFVSVKLRGKGTFGRTYMAKINNGITIVVKRLIKSVMSISELDFKRHLNIVGNIRHENVVSLRAYYSSNDERLLLYDYHSKGSVYALLHGQTGENRTHVDWQTRLKIAIGAARGIAVIHTQNGGKLVHGNIKASNIFLDLQNYGCLSDISFANMIETTFVQSSDVYSFGILLFELLTRKSPIQVPGGPDGVDLVKVVSSVKSKISASKVFDADLLKNRAIREQLVRVLQIGTNCVAKSPKKRPQMSDVVKMLEDVRMMNTGSHVSMEQEFVFIGDDNSNIDLVNLLLTSSAEFLGKGKFGKGTFWPLKAILRSGSIIEISKLADVNVRFKEFQQHMEVIGRMKHENVAQLRAYYFSTDGNLLVYDYNNQGSLFALLHGTDGISLGWKTRLKIAVGAARGIAHIHRQIDHKLVHGNIRSSTIFLNEQQYGVISNVGLAKLTSPIKRSSMLMPEYCAPEVTDSRNVSQASDVYSFGVVLLELLSRRPSQETTYDGDVISLVRWVEFVIRHEGITQVFDVEIMRYQNEEAMMQFLQIAMACVSIAPERRPRMPQVVKMLEEISGVESFIDSRLEDTLGQTSIVSRLEVLLEDLLLKLTP